MVTRLVSSMLLLSLIVVSGAYAQGGCIQNSMGQVVCGPPGGGAHANSMGQVLCGPGQCVVNSMGQVYCSSQPVGGAAVNNMGQAVCAGGCVQGNVSYCETPR